MVCWKGERAERQRQPQREERVAKVEDRPARVDRAGDALWRGRVREEGGVEQAGGDVEHNWGQHGSCCSSLPHYPRPAWHDPTIRRTLRHINNGMPKPRRQTVSISALPEMSCPRPEAARLSGASPAPASIAGPWSRPALLKKLGRVPTLVLRRLVTAQHSSVASACLPSRRIAQTPLLSMAALA